MGCVCTRSIAFWLEHVAASCSSAQSNSHIKDHFPTPTDCWVTLGLAGGVKSAAPAAGACDSAACGSAGSTGSVGTGPARSTGAGSGGAAGTTGAVGSDAAGTPTAGSVSRGNVGIGTGGGVGSGVAGKATA